MKEFQVTPDDLAGMEEIARVSSRGPSLGSADFGGRPRRWTELAVYYREGFNRPFVAVAEGKSLEPGERHRFQYAAMGTLARAMNWFEGSALRDELAAAIPEDWQPAPVEGDASIAPRRRPGDGAFAADEADLDRVGGLGQVSKVLAGMLNVHVDHGDAYVGHYRDIEAIKDQIDRYLTSATARGGNPADGAPFYKGAETLTDALAWLYPEESTDRARAIAFERDFAMSERTVRNSLAIEAGRVKGEVGPWLAPFLKALRFFDRSAWEKSRG